VNEKDADKKRERCCDPGPTFDENMRLATAMISACGASNQAGFQSKGSDRFK